MVSDELKLFMLKSVKLWSVGEPVVTLELVLERLLKGHASLSELFARLDKHTREAAIEECRGLLKEHPRTPVGDFLTTGDWEAFDKGALLERVVEKASRHYRALVCAYKNDRPKILNVQCSQRDADEKLIRAKFEQAGLSVAAVVRGTQLDPKLFEILWNWQWPEEPTPSRHFNEEEVDAIIVKMTEESPINRGEIYIHYKALNTDNQPKHAYHVLHLALLAEGCVPCVVYYDMRAPHRIWVRELEAFAADVSENGAETHRFHELGYSADFAPEGANYG